MKEGLRSLGAALFMLIAASCAAEDAASPPEQGAQETATFASNLSHGWFVVVPAREAKYNDAIERNAREGSNYSVRITGHNLGFVVYFFNAYASYRPNDPTRDEAKAKYPSWPVALENIPWLNHFFSEEAIRIGTASRETSGLPVARALDFESMWKKWCEGEALCGGDMGSPLGQSKDSTSSFCSALRGFAHVGSEEKNVYAINRARGGLCGDLLINPRHGGECTFFAAKESFRSDTECTGMKDYKTANCRCGKEDNGVFSKQWICSDTP